MSVTSRILITAESRDFLLATWRPDSQPGLRDLPLTWIAVGPCVWGIAPPRYCTAGQTPTTRMPVVSVASIALPTRNDQSRLAQRAHEWIVSTYEFMTGLTLQIGGEFHSGQQNSKKFQLLRAFKP